MLTLHKLSGGTIPYKTTLFPGGEPFIQIDPEDMICEDVWIEAHLNNMVDFGYLLAACDVLSQYAHFLGLYIPYFPGARQDHPMPGTPNTLRINVETLTQFGFDCIIVADPHSFKLVEVLSQISVVHSIRPHHILECYKGRYNGVIAPDKGATQRVQMVAEEWGVPVIQCEKIREQATGKLSGFRAGILPGIGRYLMVDDICDGGGTFIGLAEQFRKTTVGGASVIDLYTTHGIYSKGFRPLTDAFERIITTNSFSFYGTRPRQLEVIDITPLASAVMQRRLV